MGLLGVVMTKPAEAWGCGALCMLQHMLGTCLIEMETDCQQHCLQVGYMVRRPWGQRWARERSWGATGKLKVEGTKVCCTAGLYWSAAKTGAADIADWGEDGACACPMWGHSLPFLRTLLLSWPGNSR